MKVRSVIKVGDSNAVTLPKETGLQRGDAVTLVKEGDKIIIRKVELPS